MHSPKQSYWHIPLLQNMYVTLYFRYCYVDLLTEGVARSNPPLQKEVIQRMLSVPSTCTLLSIKSVVQSM